MASSKFKSSSLSASSNTKKDKFCNENPLVYSKWCYIQPGVAIIIWGFLVVKVID